MSVKAPLEHMNTDGHRPASVLLDAAQAAAYLGVSRQFLRQASLSGEVAYVDLRGRGTGARNLMRWRIADLDAWIERSLVPATVTTPAALKALTPPQSRSVSAGHRTPPRAPGTRGRSRPLLSAKEVLRSVA